MHHVSHSMHKRSTFLNQFVNIKAEASQSKPYFNLHIFHARRSYINLTEGLALKRFGSTDIRLRSELIGCWEGLM